jgi:hypothetical protein
MHSPFPFPPPAPPSSARASPARIAAALAGLLAARGVTRVYTAACELFAVISVAGGLTVWTNGLVLWWEHGGLRQSWPAADTERAAGHLAATAAPDRPR